MKLLETIEKKWSKLFRKESRGTIWGQEIDGSRHGRATLSPDAMRFLNCIHEFRSIEPMKLPIFAVSANIATEGFVTAASTKQSMMRNAIMQELDEALEEWPQTLNVVGVRVNGTHKDGNFILEFTFRDLGTPDQGCCERAESD